MIQRHSMILWKTAERENKSFEEISKEATEMDCGVDFICKIKIEEILERVS